MALYGDLAIKADTLAGSSLADSSRLVSPLLVLSAADTPAPALSQYRAPRFQLGAALVLSALAYFRLWLRQRGESLQPPPAYALPLLATAALAAGVALLPELAARVFPPADIAQFSYRFIMFVLAAVPMAALAFKGLFPAKPGAGSDGARRGAALALAFFAAAGAAPYLYPPAFIKDWSKTVYEELMAAEGILLPYGNDAYLRCPPPQGSPDWAPPGTRPLPPLPRAGSSARRVFAADLSAAPRLPDGAVPLDVLYYPGIQKFSFRVDGRESQVEIRTYWLPRERLGDARDAAFHGPAALGLPGMGLLEAEARFTGMGWSNAVSAAALSAYVLSWIAVLRRGGTAPALARRAGRRENPGGALLTLPAPRLSIRLRKAIIGPRISGGDRPRTADRLRAD
jgi:hypothetical protein